MAFERNSGLQLYLKQIKDIPLLTAEEEKQLALAFKRGDVNAKAKLVAANLRLVVMSAKHYIGRSALTFEDLIQEGNIGLMRAVDTFDPELGWRFSTYAMHWIKQAMSRAVLNQSKIVRIPVHMVELKTKYNKAQNDLYDKFGREATSEEVAQYLNINIKKVKEVEEIIKEPISLNTTLSEDDDNTLEDLIADTSLTDPDEIIDNVLLSKQIDALLETLSPREKSIVIARYGLNSQRPKTLEELGKEYNLSKERIRQIEQQALRKFRNPNRANLLKAYL